MDRLLIVAPNADIYRSSIEVVEESGIPAQVIQATSADVLERVAQVFADGQPGVIVARGHQAQILRDGQSVPVVQIVLSPQDMVSLMDRARTIAGHPHPHVAFIGFRSMFSDCEQIARLIGVEMELGFGATGPELPEAVARAVEHGAEVIIGGEIACQAAVSLGVRSLFMDQMKGSILQAIRSALHTLDALRLERRRVSEVTALLDYSFDAILRLD